MDKICKDFYIGENDPITIRLSEDVKITVEMDKEGVVTIFGTGFDSKKFSTTSGNLFALKVGV